MNNLKVTIKLVYIIFLVFLTFTAAYMGSKSGTRLVGASALNMASKTAIGSIISENRQALGEYEFEERLHAGIKLVGTEVRSLRKKGEQ